MNSRHLIAGAATIRVAVAPLTLTASTDAGAGGATTSMTRPGRVVVSPHGPDVAAGGPARPLRTIAAAIVRLGGRGGRGGTVLLRGGLYHQRIRLVGRHHLTVRPYRHEHPVPAGVYVHGHDRNVRILGNHVHDLGNDTLGSFDINAHGIAAYGDDARRPIRGLVIAGNLVQRIRSRGNPAYWEGGSWCDCAGGVYVDGGSHIRIARNRVADSDTGIEVAAENPRGTADHVTVIRNRVTGSLFTGITTGGYCNGAKDCGGRTGSSHDNVFTRNWLRGNNRLDDGSPELLVQYYAYRITFPHNTLIATNTAQVVYGTVPGHGSAGVQGQPGNHSDGNHFRTGGAGPAQLEFGWRGHTYTGAGHYVATGQDGTAPSGSRR